jgi:hypothetical protein
MSFLCRNLNWPLSVSNAAYQEFQSLFTTILSSVIDPFMNCAHIHTSKGICFASAIIVENMAELYYTLIASCSALEENSIQSFFANGSNSLQLIMKALSILSSNTASFYKVFT